MKSYKIPQVKIRMVKEGSALKSYTPFNSPKAVCNSITNELKDYDREALIVVCLDTSLKPINFCKAALGNLDECNVYIPNIFKTAILSNARYILIAHNHPSGDMTPSLADCQITERIAEVGKLIGIPLLDHVICGDGSYYSLKENEPDLF